MAYMTRTGWFSLDSHGVNLFDLPSISQCLCPFHRNLLCQDFRPLNIQSPGG